MADAKLVVLDARTTTPRMGEAVAGEPDWSALQPLAERMGGELVIHAATEPDQILERAAGAEALILNKTVLTGDHLQALPNLRYIGLLSTGTNAVDLEAAARLGVAVANAPSYSTFSVTQHVFALLLELTQQTARHAEAVAEGRWSNTTDFCFTLAPLHELEGRTFGVVGFGEIGRQTAAVASALGMEVVVHSRTQRPGPVSVTWLDLPTLLERADVVSLTCPLTPETEGLIDAAALRRMKPTAYLINTGRGGLVDSRALAAALEAQEIAGAGLDVLDAEPPATGHPLVAAAEALPPGRLVVTPHIAWATQAARTRLIGIVADNLEAFLDGRRVHRVEPSN